MSPWSDRKDNGGATAQGVTKESVKVVVYIENEQQLAGASGSQAPVDQATEQTATVRNAIRDTLEAFGHAQQNLHTYQTWGRTIDVQVFEATGGAPVLAAATGFAPDDPQAADGMPIAISKMKDAGVTSVILFAPGPLVSAILTAADSQGLDQGTNSTTIPTAIGFIYGSVQYAGPTPTAENVRKGWFSVPAARSPRTGQSGYGFTTGMPYPEYAASGTDRALAFWDGEPTGNTQAGPPVGQGVFQYVDGGKRYSVGTMPKTEPKFLDMKGAVFEVPLSASFPDGVVPVATPCTGCPSSGAAPTG